LRNQFAVNYLKPEAHFALAQYFLDKNDKIQAFYILEYARRYRFSTEEYDAAYVKFFGDFSAEPDVKAKEAFEKGYELLKTNKYDEAEQMLVKSANLAPKSFFIQAWVGRFFHKVRENNERALPYYFDAYFLYPHAYETEYVESRIRNITFADANDRFEELLKSGKSLPEISMNSNPLIVSIAVERMGKQWKKEYAKPVSEVMNIDESGVRWLAFTTLYKNAGESFDAILSGLLNEKDLRKKGFAAYPIAENPTQENLTILKIMLKDKAELIRFDALSALALSGGKTGLEILKAHRKIETNAILKQLIDRKLQGN
jgi:hypothetical protein